MEKNLWQEKIKKIAERTFCYDWVKLNQIKGEKGNPLEFKKHSFLIDIFDDWTPVQTTRKASQIGFSTLMILKTLWAMRYKGWNIIYTLPSYSDVSQFVPSKVNAIIQQNPILAEWTKDKDTIFQKKVGNSFIYYRGTQLGKAEEKGIESATGIMLTSDLNVHDEADRSTQAILQQYESRLEASDYKGRWYFSNPTHPNTLTQELWKKSDQKYWFVKPSCGHWQYLEYPDNIQNGKFVCKKCGREITDEDRMNGEWIRRFRHNKDVSGYWISQLIAPWHSAKEIEEKAKTRTKDYFYNFVLGLPYRGADVVVDRDLILGCIDYSLPNLLQDNVLGVDVGLKKHYVLGNKQGIFKIGKVDSWEDIELLMRKYDVRVAVFDALPDLTEPRKLQKKYLGVVWLSYFKKEIKRAEYIKWDNKSYTVYSDRSKMLGLLVDEFADRKRRFQMKPEDLDEYIKHWETVFKTKQENNLGIEEEIWDTEGEDHYCFATLFWRLALERMGIGSGTGIIGTELEEVKNLERAPDIRELVEKQNQSPDDWKI